VGLIRPVCQRLIDAGCVVLDSRRGFRKLEKAVFSGDSVQKALRVFNIALTWRSTVFTLCVSECAILIFLGVAELKKNTD
jgi:hypothetical protein